MMRSAEQAGGQDVLDAEIHMRGEARLGALGVAGEGELEQGFVVFRHGGAAEARRNRSNTEPWVFIKRREPQAEISALWKAQS